MDCRRPWPMLLISAFYLASVSCGGSDFEPFEPVECEPVSVDVGDRCVDFCARAVGDCDALEAVFGEGFDEADCQVTCQADISEGYGCSASCGVALEAMFQCVAETDDCQDVVDWLFRAPGDHACRSAADTAGANCPF